MYKVLDQNRRADGEANVATRSWQLLSVSAKAAHHRRKVKSSEIKATFLTSKGHTRQMR